VQSHGSEDLPKRKEAISRQLSDEFLVYDNQTNKAHCLNKTAAEVWSLCDGQTSIPQMAEKLQLSSDDLVRMAVDDLGKAGLLETYQPSADAARRDTLRKLGFAAAIAVPLVISVLVPTPAQAAS